MNMFYKLPDSITIQDKKYKINADYRIMIYLESRVQDNDKNKAVQGMKKTLRDFYIVLRDENEFNKLMSNANLYKEFCDKMIWFYLSGRENYHKTNGGNGKSASEIYSYEHDDEYIFGAFLNQYNIDLSEDFVHWWKFKALVKSLKSDTEFVKIKGYRAYTGEDKDMLTMKNYYALPLSKTEQERQDKLYEMLK